MSAAAEQLNPRFVAYCRAVGIAPTVEALRERDGNWADFMAWIAAQRRAFYGGNRKRDTVAPGDQDAFTAFCEAAAAKGAT